MKLTLLGTGNAAGLPLHGCNCRRCVLGRANVRLRRTPCSALLRLGDKQFLLDAGQVDLTDRFPAGTLDGIFLTHFHPDHVQGLFHLRWSIGDQIPVYTPPDSTGCADLYKHAGILKFLPQRKFETFQLDDLLITPVPLIHSKPTFGYVFEHDGSRIAYLTDTKGLPPTTLELLAHRRLDLMVIDCSFIPGSEKAGHNNLDDVIEIIGTVHPQRTALTHIGHDLDLWFTDHPDRLPADVIVGRDDMVVFQAG